MRDHLLFILADSALIIAGLVKSDILPILNSSLAPAPKTQDMAIRALLEDKLHFYGVSTTVNYIFSSGCGIF